MHPEVRQSQPGHCPKCGMTLELAASAELKKMMSRLWRASVLAFPVFLLRNGILVKNAEALERLEKITTLVVDKTGTLTEGHPSLTDILPAGGFEAAGLERFAASLERSGEHPLATAVGAEERQIVLAVVQDFRSVTAGGVVGTIEARAVIVGKPELLRTKKITGVEGLEALAEKLQLEGKTTIFVAIDGRAAGVLAVSDPVKSGAIAAVAELPALGLQIFMLTGDHRRTADAVAKRLGLDGVEAGVDPSGKSSYIKGIRGRGEHVAMVGDGINDALALSEAEVGIAMGTGTEVAIQSAGITLLKGELQGIAKAIHLSRATMRNIRQNQFSAFLYNFLGIPVAAGVLYSFFGALLSPMVAGAAMSLSSVSVITNALRLRKVNLQS